MVPTKQHTLWVERYRPDTLEGYIGNDAMKTKFARYIEEGQIPHLLLTGPAGTGKTTAAKILIRNVECDAMVLNASDDNNIETVRGKIRGFASTVSFKPLKIILLDEFDGFSRQGQEALRNLMEQFSHSTRFILTANYIERVIEPIISRTQHFQIIPVSNKEVMVHAAKILRLEEVTYAAADVKTIVDAYFPDIRKVLNELQLATHNKTLTVDAKQIVENDIKLKIVELLASKRTPKEKFTNIRQLIADAHLREFTDVYRVCYDRVTEYASGNVSAVILALAEGQYRDALVVDKEICFMATVVNILSAMS